MGKSDRDQAMERDVGAFGNPLEGAVMKATGNWMRALAALVALASCTQPVAGQSSPPAGIARRPLSVPNPLPRPATGFQWDYACRALPANCQGSVFGNSLDGYSQASVVAAEVTVSNRKTLLFLWWATRSTVGANPSSDKMGIVFLDTANLSIQLTGFALESAGAFDLP
jgi:hypothetical protein